MNTPQLNRQIILDTETTGMNTAGGPVYLGHRIIEIGCVEVINRKLTGNHFHVYIKPDRLVDPEAIQVHGITDEFLRDKPSFSQIADEFIEFIRGAELIAHNAPFDVSFMDYEFGKLGLNFKTADICGITDTLAMARDLFRQAQQPRRAVRSLRHRQLAPYPARGFARCGDPGGRLPADDGWPD